MVSLDTLIQRALREKNPKVLQGKSISLEMELRRVVRAMDKIQRAKRMI